MKKLLLTSILSSLFFPTIVSAVCPVCTVAVGAGLGLAEYLGIDDLISGLWIGALTVSLIIWTVSWLDRKGSTLRNPDNSVVGRKRSNLGRNFLVTVGYYILIVGPLWWKGFIGQPLNQFCGVDRLLLGIFIGSILFLAGAATHGYLRKKNNGQSYFKGQKIAAAVIPIVIASIIFYFVC